jgi:hypothetical protein
MRRALVDACVDHGTKKADAAVKFDNPKKRWKKD